MFLEVARTGSLSQAARGLSIDHSTVSRRVSQLEAALGAGIFERGRTGFRLNYLGERLLARAEGIESAVNGIRSEVGAEEAAGAGTVRLATMEGNASLYIAPRLLRLREIGRVRLLRVVAAVEIDAASAWSDLRRYSDLAALPA